MVLRRNDGTDIIATWRPKVMGLDIPSLVVGDQVIDVIEPLKWYEWAWSGLPILLVFIGGALGALTGFIGFSANTKIFRTDYTSVLKFAVTAGISIIAVIVYFVLAMIFVSLVG
jgi:hypothetical protein